MSQDIDKVHPPVFVAVIDGDTWQEQYLKADKSWTDYLGGRHSDAAGVFDATDLPAGAAVLIQYETPTGMRYAKVTNESSGSFFPVLVVWSAGSDGDATNYATWTYNIYGLTDTGHASALTGSAVQPENSPARIVKGPVTKAATDSVGQAYYAADGTIHLYTCCEKHGTGACT